MKTKMIKKWLLAVVLCGLAGTLAPTCSGATVNGTIAGWTNVSGYATATVRFEPDAPYVLLEETNLLILVNRTVAPGEDGTFSIELEEGGWQALLPGILRRVRIAVPEGAGPFEFSTLITNAPTFAWTNFVYPIPASAIGFEVVSNNYPSLTVTNLSLGGTNVVWPLAASQMGFEVVSNNWSSLSLTNLVLRAVTNAVEWAVTNTAPADTNAVLWISVRVTGDTNAYRMPLMR